MLEISEESASPGDSTWMLFSRSGSTGVTDILLFLDLCEADLGSGIGLPGA